MSLSTSLRFETAGKRSISKAQARQQERVRVRQKYYPGRQPEDIELETCAIIKFCFTHVIER